MKLSLYELGAALRHTPEIQIGGHMMSVVRLRSVCLNY